ncbi:MAG TPA: hypothetical protein VN736_23215 [Candidatus Limnocylindrales bacterium]|nr:hypothetical protein [Candidatus Limnocylindrales bacterium]
MFGFSRTKNETTSGVDETTSGVDETMSTVNSFDQRGAELQAQRKDVDAAISRLNELEAACRATATEMRAAEAEFRRLSDPITALEASPEMQRAAGCQYLAAKEAARKADEARNAFSETREELHQRHQLILAEEAQLRKDRIIAADREDSREYLAQLLAVDALHARMVARRMSNPAIGLPGDVLLSPGIFDVADAPGHAGDNAPSTKTVFRDHVLRGFARSYPDLIPAGLMKDDILTAEADRQLRGAPRWRPAPVSWMICSERFK